MSIEERSNIFTSCYDAALKRWIYGIKQTKVMTEAVSVTGGCPVAGIPKISRQEVTIAKSALQ